MSLIPQPPPALTDLYNSQPPWCEVLTHDSYNYADFSVILHISKLLTIKINIELALLSLNRPNSILRRREWHNSCLVFLHTSPSNKEVPVRWVRISRASNFYAQLAAAWTARKLIVCRLFLSKMQLYLFCGIAFQLSSILRQIFTVCTFIVVNSTLYYFYLCK